MQKKVRITIEVLFERVYYPNYSPDKLPQYVKAICDTLKYPNHATVKKVILDVKKALDEDGEYDEERKSWTNDDRYKIEKGYIWWAPSVCMEGS